VGKDIDLNVQTTLKPNSEQGAIAWGCSFSRMAKAVLANSSVIAGNPNQGTGDCAFNWDSPHGIRNLQTVLVDDYGLNLTGWQGGPGP
jgi:hypothetical protein